MAKTRVSIMLTDEGLYALDFVSSYYGFSHSKMVENLLFQSKRKIDNTPALEQQLSEMQTLLSKFEDTQKTIVGGTEK